MAKAMSRTHPCSFFFPPKSFHLLTYFNLKIFTGFYRCFYSFLTRSVDLPPPMPAPTTHTHPRPSTLEKGHQPTNELLVGFSPGRRLKRPPTSHCDSLRGFSPTHHLPSPSTHLPRPSALDKGPPTHQRTVGGSASPTPAQLTPNESL